MEQYDIEIFDENGVLIAWVTKDGVIGGEQSELIVPAEDGASIDSATMLPITGNVKIYYDGSSWTKIASWGESEEKEFKDFNGVAIINKAIPFDLQFKDSEGVESTLYTVQGKGKFLFHEDGTWEKVGE